jgi:glutaredoxin-like protein
MTTPQITVYWRPGCPFCSMLHRDLQRAELDFDMRNIWEDPDAAAFVRSVARGNETVPTVAIGDAALVNPRVAEVIELLEAQRGQTRNT